MNFRRAPPLRSEVTEVQREYRFSNPELSAFRGWRDLKGSLRLRPVYHHREDRIRSHIQLCWLGLLLIRVAENATGDTWRNLRHELDRMHLVTLETREGRIAKRSATTTRQREILAALEIREPAQILDYALPTPAE